MDHHQFAELRSLLNRTPTVELFYEILDVLGAGDVDANLMQYAQDHIERWPNGYTDPDRPDAEHQLWLSREMPFEWVDDVLYGGTLGPAAFLCDEVFIEYTHMDANMMTNLVSQPWFANIHGLTIAYEKVDADALEVLVHAPTARQIKWLNLACSEMGVEQARALAGATQLHSLESLDLTMNERLGDDLALILRAPCFAKLETIEIAGCDMGDEAIAALCAHRNIMTHTTYWDMSENLIGDDGCKALADCKWMPALQRLNLANNEISAHGLRTLFAAPWIEQCQNLILHHNRFGDLGMAEIAVSPWLATQRSLVMSDCAICADGAIALAKSPYLDNIQKLALYNNGIGPEGVAAIAQASWPSLESLNLSTTFASGQGVAALAQSTTMPKLREFSLTHGNLTPQDIRALADAPWCTQLEKLSLAGCRCGDQVALRLLRSLDWSRMTDITMAAMGLGQGVVEFFMTVDAPRLERLHLGANDFGIQSVAKLKARFAHLRERTIS